MGLFSFLPWVDDDPEPVVKRQRLQKSAPSPTPAPRPSPQESRKPVPGGGTESSSGIKYMPHGGEPAPNPINVFGGNPDDPVSRLFNWVTGAKKPASPYNSTPYVPPATPAPILAPTTVPTPTPTGTPAPAVTPSPTATPSPTGTPSPTASLDPDAATGLSPFIRRPAETPAPAGLSPFIRRPTAAPTPPAEGGDEWSRIRDLGIVPPAAPAANPFAPALAATEGTGTTSVAAAAPHRNTASEPIRQLLLNAGWTVPGGRAAIPGSIQGLDMTKVRNLKTYDYTLDPEEWEIVQAAYTGQEGYKPGRNIKADQLPRISSNITRSAPMTWEAYNALTDDQRKAVDFNTLLVEARERDIGRQNPSMKAGDYTAVRDRVFGEKGGSRIVGSDTLNLLDKMGVQAQGQDLDEFLSLDRAITTDELKDFKITAGEPVAYEQRTMGILEGMNSPTQLKTNFAESRGLANLSKLDAATIQKAGEFISGAMKVQEGAPWSRDMAISAALGAPRPTSDRIPYGWALGPDERTSDTDLNKEKFFQESYQHLQNRDEADTRWIWEGMETFNFDDADRQELFDYFDTRSRWEESTGTLDPNLRTGAEIRQFAGIEGG